MPGIAGILDLNGTDLTHRLVRMLGSLKAEDWHKTDSFTEPGFGIGRVSLGVINAAPQPVFNSDRSLLLCMAGEIYSYPEEAPKLYGSSGSSSSDNDAKRVLQLIERRGIEAVNQLNGAFVLALWNSQERSLTIANDRFGLKPVYYFHEDNLFLFASEVKVLLAAAEVNQEADPQAVLEFLTFEFILGGKTFFKKIKVLDPASILVFKNGDLVVKRYWEAGWPHDGNSFFKNDPVERGKQLLCQAVERQTREKKGVALALSGGLDSRLILAAATEVGRPVPTFTFGQKDCDDRKIAQLVAETAGSDNYFFELSSGYLSRWAERGVWQTDGMDNCTNFAGIELHSKVGEKWRIVLNGSGGNELWGGISPGLLKFLFIQDKKKLTEAFFRKMSTGFSEASCPELFQPGFYVKIKGAAYDSFMESLSRAPDQSPLGKIYHFYRHEKTRRGTLMGLVMDSDQIEYRLPFFDYDLFDFILTIPNKLRVLAQFKRRLIVRKFPRMAFIPYQRTGLSVDASLISILFRRFGNRFVSFFQKGGLLADRGCVDNAGWLRNELQDFVNSTLLNPKALDRGYFKPEYIRRLVERHLSGKQNFSSQLGLLLTFELWNRLFIDGEIQSKDFAG